MCASRKYTWDRNVWYLLLDVLASSFVWLRVYESLHTCAVRNRSRRRSASSIYSVRTSNYLLLNALDILRRNMVGYLRSTWRWGTWILEPSLVWVAARSGWWQTSPSLLTPASGFLARCAIFSRDMFPANTMAYDTRWLALYYGYLRLD